MPTWKKEARFFGAASISETTELEFLDEGQDMQNTFGKINLTFHVKASNLNGEDGTVLEDGEYLWAPNQTQGDSLTKFWGTNTYDWKGKKIGFRREVIDFGTVGRKKIAIPVLLTGKGK